MTTGTWGSLDMGNFFEYIAWNYNLLNTKYKDRLLIVTDVYI